MDFQYLNEDFDDAFKEIDNLTWLPWVGDNYLNSDDSNKLLLLGESAYAWTHEGKESAEKVTERLSKPYFTREMVEKSHGMNHESEQRFYRNIERALLLKKRPHPDATKQLWRSVCFHNLVLDAMINQNNRPSVEQYHAGWELFYRLVDIIKPTMCLVAGTDIKVVLSCIEEAEKKGYKVTKPIWRERVGRAKAVKLEIEQDDNSKLSIIFIKHPSKFFSWKRWGTFLSEKAPECFSPFRKAISEVV